MKLPKPLPNKITNSVEELIPFARIRLIIADLDGTLLDSKKMIWQDIQRLKRSISHYGVKITIATGRTFKGIENILKQLKIQKNIPIILYNGSVVIRNGKIKPLVKKTIPLQVFNHLFNLINIDLNVQILAYFYNEKSFTNQKSSIDNKNLEFILGWSENDRPEREFNNMFVEWLNWGEYPISLYPSAILINTKSQNAIKDLNKNIIKKIPDITITQSGTNFFELRPVNSNKGEAMEIICDYLKYKPEEVLAIGDNDNDSELLFSAGIGLAVKNSSRKAMESSNFITDYDSAGGVMEALRLVKEAKRFIGDKSFKEKVWKKK